MREEDHESETKGYISKETEFEQICVATEGNDDKGESSMPPRKVSLKPLPPSLKYAYLDANGNKPVIVSFELDDTSLEKLLALLNKYQSVIGYSLDDIKGISPKLVMHRIPLDDEHFSSIEPQRRLNPNMKEVIKEEILKLLKAGIIYSIFDSRWVSLVHVVPKK